MSFRCAFAILVFGVFQGAAIAGGDSFDAAKPGPLPASWDGAWTGTQTGEGAARWTIESDASAPSPPQVLAQRGEAKFPVALRNETVLADGFVEVKFKAVSGDEDQAAGVVWRARDANNYYVCRANALEGNVVLYKMVDGKRSSLDIVGREGGYGVKEPVAEGRWHALRVEFRGTRFVVKLDGKQLFEVEDATFSGAGKLGVWTKADSVTLFDDFKWGSQ